MASRFHLTDRAIKALPILPKRYDRCDANSKGLLVRVYPSGSKRFYYRFMHNARRLCLLLGIYPYYSIAEAQQAYFTARVDVEHGRNPIEVAKLNALSRITISELAADYVTWCEPRKKSWREDQRLLNRDVVPVWRKRLVGDIQRGDIKTLLNAKASHAPAMANRVHATLHTMFQYAIEEREIIARNPMAGMSKPAQAGERYRALSLAEIANHWHGIDQFEGMHRLIRLCILFKLTTAQRTHETLTARWADIHLDDRLWIIPSNNTKALRGDHRVPLSNLAVQLLQQIKVAGNGSPLLFPSPRIAGAPMIDTVASRGLSKYLKSLRYTRTDAAWFTVHDLRRTAATGMGDLRIDGKDISRVLNHAEGGITRLYDRALHDPEKRYALDKWGQQLEQAIAHTEQGAAL